MTSPSFPARLPDHVRLDALAHAPADPADEPEIPFTPVRRLRNRRSGWTEARQRAFIAALTRCGSVKAAAGHVGLSVRTAYKLLDAEGAGSFAAAWDRAVDIGRARIQADALERALSGSFVPIYRRGRLVRVEYRRCDRLAIALLGGKERSPIDYHGAVQRARRRAEDREAARKEAEWKAACKAEMEKMIERGQEIARQRRQPRVRML